MTELLEEGIVTTLDHWSRSSVTYQIYPRSFKDSNNDGIGDLPGITSKLHELKDLGVDSVWISPFYKSPQKDGGYDVADYCDVDPMFGTLGDFDLLLSEAKHQGLRVIIDLVPNHCSSEHALFQAALKAGRGSKEREMFIFRDGVNGGPPNNWQSHFEGSAWTQVEDGQWYLHLFDTSQPDWNWSNPAVHAEFERVIRFWLDRGVDGFRVDVAHALFKKNGLPDWGGRADGNTTDGFPGADAPMFGQPELHELYKEWRKILDSYGPDRVLCAEANVDPLSRMVEFVRKGEMHQTFNFAFMHAGWNLDKLREVIDESLTTFEAVEAMPTWVLSNHDVVRTATRLGLESVGDGVGPDDVQPDMELGTDRARAMALLMLALPGSAYLYQGEELGLGDNTQIPAEDRQDPSFRRSGGKRIGRDGCRVPLPWEFHGKYLGFSTGTTWLPLPYTWGRFSRQWQKQDPTSTLNLYKNALGLRNYFGLGEGTLEWVDMGENLLAFKNGTVTFVMNMGKKSVPLRGFAALSSYLDKVGVIHRLHPNDAVWLVG
ncbi:glycoside hydrolase [Arthrobacter phage Racecar]|nr:glycoside hydrolase [Arthrobacter phage Racecar]QFG12729.1 glycoside hydrolase [Arthrobacter phage Mimi]